MTKQNKIIKLIVKQLYKISWKFYMLVDMLPVWLGIESMSFETKNKLDSKVSEIELKSDSELLIKQLNGKYKIIDEKIQKLFLKIWNLKFDFKKIKFSHISRIKNKRADSLANQALDEKAKNQKLF